MNLINLVTGPSFFYKTTPQPEGLHEVTLHHKDIVEVGDELKILPINKSHTGLVKVKQVLENRDCAGNWNDPERAKGSFWRVLVTLHSPTPTVQ